MTDVQHREAPESEESDAEVTARMRAQLAERDGAYERLLRDARWSFRAMEGWFGVKNEAQWEEICRQAREEYHAGRFLLDRLGAERHLEPRLMATLWGLRQSLVEEMGARTPAETMLVDLAVAAYAQALRIQDFIGSWSLVAEDEAFGQERLRARFHTRHGHGAGEIQGLWIEEHVRRVREQLLPLLERFNRVAEDHLRALQTMRSVPSIEVEQSAPVDVRIRLG